MYTHKKARKKQKYEKQKKEALFSFGELRHIKK